MSVGHLVSPIYRRLRPFFPSVDPTYSIWLTPAVALCNDVVEVVHFIVIDVGYLIFIHEWLLTSAGVNPLGAICVVPGYRKS